jgi:hypothetical protein
VNDAEWRRAKERLLLPQKERPGAYLDELRRRAQEEREAEERKHDKQLDLFG